MPIPALASIDDARSETDPSSGQQGPLPSLEFQFCRVILNEGNREATGQLMIGMCAY